MENISFSLGGADLFFSDKYDITKHKNYRLLEDYDKENRFNVERYVKQMEKVKLKKNTVIMRM